MKIWVDADACPVVIKEILYRAAYRTGVLVTLVANKALRIPNSEYVAMLQDFRDRLEEESLATDFAFANRVRDSIPRDAKGFIHQLNEILVQAEDRPGILAEIATAMREESININDIEIVKVREGEGGTIRLGFDAEDAAQRALAVLHRLGYQARRP